MVGETQTSSKVGLLVGKWSTCPLAGRSRQIQSGGPIRRWPKIATSLQTKLLADSWEIAVGQGSTVSIDVGVIQTGSITLELEAIGQFVLGGEHLGIQIMPAVVEEIGMGFLLENVFYSGSVGFG